MDSFTLAAPEDARPSGGEVSKYYPLCASPMSRLIRISAERKIF